MANYVVRVWLPDRPGALGAVASRIGAVRGDLVGIEILERGGGRAIDELVISLPDDGLVDLLIGEITQVDGVAVEDVRAAGPARRDAIDVAAALVEQVQVQGLADVLVSHARDEFEATWCALLDVDSSTALARAGTPPPARWLSAFVAGSRSSVRVAAGECGPDDVAWAVLDVAGLAVVLGRDGRPFRARERQQLTSLARIADVRWAELVIRASRAVHPSAV